MDEFQEERSYQLRNYLQHEMTRLKQVSLHALFVLVFIFYQVSRRIE